MGVRRGVAAAVLAGLVAAACGGGEEAAAPATTASTAATTTTTAAPTTTTTAPPDPAVVALAKASVLVLADLPAGRWVEYQGPKAGEGETRSSCVPEAAPKPLPGGTESGASFQLGTTKRFVTTVARVMADVPAAQALTAAYATPAFAECVRAQSADTQAKAAGNPPGATMRLNPEDVAAAGVGKNGLEAYVAMRFQSLEGDKLVDGGYDLEYGYYRIGRVVITMQTDLAPEQADPKDASSAYNQGLTVGFDKVFTRARAAQPA